MTAPMLREVFIDPQGGAPADGMRIGDLVFAPLLRARPAGGPAGEERTRAQLAEVLDTMDRFLDAAGATRGDVVRVTFFLRDVLERPILNDVWERWYPDAADRPPHKYVPGVHPDGVNVAIQVLALLGARREVLEIPGVQHGDPMSMGALTANLVTSSRLFGAQEDLDDQITLILERAAILLGGAGGGLGNLTQATFFVGSGEIGEAVRRRWDAEPPAEGARMHIIEADLGGGNGYPRVEILGLVDHQE
ncbi:MAG TPA: RidA family protein [Acidimicrobiales bacterium]|nr:RidA family protein [Acidimicrobiales bacterium]